MLRHWLERFSWCNLVTWFILQFSNSNYYIVLLHIIFTSGKKSKVFPSIIFSPHLWMWFCTMTVTFALHFTRNRYFSTSSTVLTTKYSSLSHSILSCSIVTWPCSAGFSPASDVLSHIPFFLLFLLCQDLCYCSLPPHRLSSYSALPCSEWFALARNAFMWLSQAWISLRYVYTVYLSGFSFSSILF